MGISDQILGYLLPDREVIQVVQATKPSYNTLTFDMHFRYDNDACHPNILQGSHQLYEIYFSRQEYPTPFGRNTKHLYGPLFEQLEIPFAKARQLGLQLRAEVDPNILDLLTNIAICCRRLDKEPSLRSLQIDFSNKPHIN